MERRNGGRIENEREGGKDKGRKVQRTGGREEERNGIELGRKGRKNEGKRKYVKCSVMFYCIMC